MEPREIDLIFDLSGPPEHFTGQGAWVIATVDGLDFPVIARLGKRTVRGRPEMVCTGLMIGDAEGGEQITARRLRAIPLVEIMQRVSEASPIVAMETPAIAPVAAGSRGLPVSEYARALAAYRVAEAARPEAPFQYIKDNELMYGSDSTIRRQVRKAKRMEAAGELEVES